MPKQHPRTLLSTALLTLSAFSSSAFSVGLTQSVEDALNFYHYGNNGAVKLDLNYRYENVDQDKGGTPNPHTANANTARLRAGLLSPSFYGFQGYAEYEGNLAMQEDFNSTRNNNTGYSIVADPEKSELNQLWISYSGIPDTVIKGGRQRIKFDDDRFIGNVGWRQMETTYDAVLLTHQNQQIFGLTINAGFIGNVQTFTSTTENIDAPILNVNYKMGDYGNIIAYGYWLDYRESENFQKSSQTYGLRATCCAKLGDSIKITDNFGLLYTAEWGNQRDYGHGPTKYEADRFNFMGGLQAYNVTLQGAVEQLNGFGANKTFDTPLGTNHAFQGWADIFLTTPNDGIRDVFGTMIVSLDRGNLVLTGMYHDFTDDTGQHQFGKEWDFMVVKKFGKHYSLLAKYANYNADNGLSTPVNTDTQKIWLQGNISF
jgi:Alginate export